jgi:Plant transposon protein
MDYTGSSDDDNNNNTDSSDDIQMSSNAATIKAAGIAIVIAKNIISGINKNSSKRTNRQSNKKRRIFDHQGCLEVIKRDHLSDNPLFGKEFIHFFRLSRPRVELLLQSLGNSGIQFYQTFRVNRYGVTGPSLEAKVLLPLKSMAYGVAPHAFADYFQMSISQSGRCCRHFCNVIPELYRKQYNRSPTASDLIAINNLHKEVHGVEGMLGSLDCMHTYWKNCPVGWQQSYKGKEAGPTIVLEAICDYNLWFWHTSYGYAGAMNDLNILNLSPFLDTVTNGDFAKLEQEAKVVPFTIDNQQFNKMFVLVDGIYPKYSRFVRGMSQPITETEKKFTAWQEGARKDIERAFAVLQCKWKILTFPMHAINLTNISNLVTTCLILHNMGVADRVMEDIHLDYIPTNAPPETVADTCDATTFPAGIVLNTPQNMTGTTIDETVAITIANKREWAALKDPKEWGRLQTALMANFLK